MKVFVTGATGVLGKRVLKRLIDQKISVVALSRSYQNTEFLRSIKVEMREADLFNQSEIIEATKGCNAILHLATHIPKKASPRLSDWRINDKIKIEGTNNLISAAKENEIGIFICQSVTALYGQQNNNEVSSGTPIPENQIKSLKSAILMEQNISSSLPAKYLIMRIGNIYSSDDFHTKSLIRNIKNGRIPMIGKGNFYLNFIHVEDAANAIVYGINSFNKLKGEIVNVTDYNPVLYSEIIKYLYPIITNKKPLFLPRFLARIFIGKTSFAFLTNSYKVKQEKLLSGWRPKHSSFISTVSKMITDDKEHISMTV